MAVGVTTFLQNKKIANQPSGYSVDKPEFVNNLPYTIFLSSFFFLTKSETFNCFDFRITKEPEKVGEHKVYSVSRSGDQQAR